MMMRNITSFKVLFIVLCAAIYFSCEKNTNKKNSPVIPPHGVSELVVWGADTILKQWLTDTIQNSVNQSNPNIDTAIHREICKSCDGKLELWSGDIIKVFASGVPVQGGTKAKTGAVGGDTIYYCLNFDMDKPFNKSLPTVTTLPSTVTPVYVRGDNNKRQLTIAVFDTGVDPGVVNIKREAKTCIDNGYNGWNFVERNKDVSDDHEARHGTIVTKYIITPLPKEMDILPVRVLGESGTSDLFKTLCGFSFAANSGVDIINTSLGFYYYDPTPPHLLVACIRKNLTEKGILLITAAGNKCSQAEGNNAIAYGIRPEDLQNIARHYFYPASLSDRLSNIIAVTTVSSREPYAVSSSQNYSAVKVNVGVLSDSVVSDNIGVFKHPFLSEYIDGSSFATPKFTNRVAIWLINRHHQFEPPFSRNDILEGMKADGMISNENHLTDSIQAGRTVK